MEIPPHYDEDGLDEMEVESPNCQEFQLSLIKTGDFLLAQFKGGRRGATTYRFVVQALQEFDEDD